MKLTKRAIDGFAHEGGWDVRWDDSVPGFGVRIYATGKKAFVLNYRAHGRKRLMVLGRYGADLTLEQARDRARKLRVQVKDGRDPLEDRHRASGGKTFGELAEAFIEGHAKPHKKTWETDRGRLERHIPQGWNRRKVATITREEVATLHARIGTTRPYEANRLLDLLRVVFKFARLRYFMDESAPNPAEGIEKYKERSRQRWVTPEEVRELAQAIDTEPNIYVRAAIWLYLLTALRKSELLEAKRDDVDHVRAQLRLPETKSGDEQTVALNAPAMAIIQAIPAQEGNPYLLPGHKKGRHLINIDKPWRRIRKVAGLDDVRLHDLRRTVGSWMSQADVDLNKIKGALRHASISTTLIYAQLGEDASREIMEDHGRRVLEAAGKSGPAEVVQLAETKKQRARRG